MAEPDKQQGLNCVCVREKFDNFSANVRATKFNVLAGTRNVFRGIKETYDLRTRVYVYVFKL